MSVARRAPTPRAEVFDAYWTLAYRRQDIFYRRLAGERPPWTNDAILLKFKFCNAYRASDRVSQYLVKDVIYGHPGNDEDTLLRTVLFRLFSHPATWQEIEGMLGEPLTRRSFNAAKLARILDGRQNRGEKLYTGAFILCANRAFGHRRKHRNHIALIQQMFRRGALPRAVSRTSSLGELFEVLRGYPLIGDFMAYQLAIDINYSELVDFDEDSFTMPGPGALRGIQKCFTDTGGRTPTQIVHWMTARQDEQFHRLGLDFKTLGHRPLKAIDTQNLFCELDKYARNAFPHLASNRTRIKSRFIASAQPLDYFYPPKWKIRLPALASRAMAS